MTHEYSISLLLQKRDRHGNRDLSKQGGMAEE